MSSELMLINKISEKFSKRNNSNFSKTNMVNKLIVTTLYSISKQKVIEENKIKKEM